jgi:hypothetical protein
MAVWSMMSAWIVVASTNSLAVAEIRLEESLATIFEYQSRYDRVYETAYPELLAGQEFGGKSSQILELKPILLVEKHPAYRGPSKRYKVSGSEDWKVIIEDLAFHRQNLDVELSLSIRNKLSPERAEGHIWAMLHLRRQNGDKLYALAPQTMDIDESGQLKSDKAKGNWYSIRYYKAKNFYFELPNGFVGTIQRIDINMKNTKGERAKFYVNLDSNPQEANFAKDELQKSAQPVIR